MIGHESKKKKLKKGNKKRKIRNRLQKLRVPKPKKNHYLIDITATKTIL